jgi:hypothetical protein
MVACHHIGISIAGMNFSRNVFATMLIAVFGAIVLAGTSAGISGPTALAASTGNAAYGFRSVFFVAAASLSIALTAILLMEEKPLQTGAELRAK